MTKQVIPFWRFGNIIRIVCIFCSFFILSISYNWAQVYKDTEAAKRFIASLKDTSGNGTKEFMFELNRVYWLNAEALPIVIPTLIEALKNRNEIIRFRSTEAIWRLGPKAESTAPFLMELLEKEKEEYIRGNAIKALITTNSNATIIVPVLVKILKDDSRSLAEKPYFFE